MTRRSNGCKGFVFDVLLLECTLFNSGKRGETPDESDEYGGSGAE